MVSPDALRLLENYPWPGNIRELRNVIERICIMRSGPALLAEYLPLEIRGAPPPGLTVSPTSDKVSLPADKGLEEAVADFERAIICQALNRTRANVLQTAALLKIPRGTLRYKMDKFGLT